MRLVSLFEGVWGWLRLFWILFLLPKPNQVAIRGLAHSLHQVCNRQLDDFIVKDERLKEFGPTEGPEIDLAPLEERPMLVTTSDEESCQFRALNLLFGPLGVRGMPIPEQAHPMWNDCSRAMASCGLKGALLKGTLLINHYAGPYKSGRFGYDLQSVSRMLMLSCTDEYLEDLSGSALIFRRQFYKSCQKPLMTWFLNLARNE